MRVGVVFGPRRGKRKEGPARGKKGRRAGGKGGVGRGRARNRFIGCAKGDEGRVHLETEREGGRVCKCEEKQPESEKLRFTLPFAPPSLRLP